MFDIWIGNINLAVAFLAAAFIIVLPIQLLLCFKVKKLIVRLIPMLVTAISTQIFGLLMIYSGGWNTLGYVLLMIMSCVLLAASLFDWGIWAVVSKIRRKRNGT